MVLGGLEISLSIRIFRWMFNTLKSYMDNSLPFLPERRKIGKVEKL